MSTSDVPGPTLTARSRKHGTQILVSLAAAIAVALFATTGAAFAKTAAHTASSEPSVVVAPIQVAHTTDGNVSYRSVGKGPVLVMIMGYSSSMDGWPPILVDTLAKHYRVIIFDNAGIGQTSPVPGIAPDPGTLTVSEMANQTDAFMRALHLGKSDVLGWSMGGMIAQALTVSHPADVKKLILCATLPGNGKGTSPSLTNLSALENPSLATAVSLEKLLFPANQQAKEVPLFTAQVSQYPNFYLASPAVDADQFAALATWFAGKDPSGPGIDHIAVPTLIGDGAADSLIPAANDYEMHKVIRHSQLVLYPDAGHGFLFQDVSAWTKRIEAFLGTK